ncbi:MAG: (Fe-S)-binding protein [Desulfatibacillum sp.]|nr:(Fe-S)-binding protein [Desulfatibacillum sp.]
MSFELNDFEEMMAKCSYCAFCQATCPVFLQDLLETHMPRARMSLAKACLVENTIPRTKHLEEILDRCLLCGNCERTCPAGIKVNDIVVAARKSMYKGKRKTFLERNFLNSFMQKRGMDWLHRTAFAVAKKIGRVPDGILNPRAQTFSKQFTGVFPAKGEKRATVAYFVGCATNSSYVETGKALLNVFTKNGIEVIVPEGLLCCGMPAIVEGDTETAYNMFMHNVRIFHKMEVDAVVTDCTTCGLMFKENGAKLAPAGTPLLEKVQGVAAKMWEATDYLNHLGLVDPPNQLDTKFTYHVPCHRAWSPTLAEAPRDVARQVPGAELCEMAEPESCCGAGGTFFVQHEELSGGIRGKKKAMIEDTGANTILTQCPACRGYLAAGCEEKVVMHPLDFLAQAYGVLDKTPQPKK